MKENITAFAENEKEANKYTAKCMLIMAIVVALVWVLNLLNIFIVPQNIMAIAATGSIVLFLIPTLLCRIVSPTSKRLKFYNMLCCIAALCLIGAAMPLHGIVVWAAPIVLSCHYYSRKFAYVTLIMSIIFMGLGIFLGALYGEWDVSIFKRNIMVGGETVVGAYINERVFDFSVWRRLIVFMFVPRALTLFGINTVCVTLANRTHNLLEKQVRDSTEKERIASELDVATHIQTSMLPNIFPAFPNYREFDVYASMTPAREVGGDFYDFFMIDENHVAVVMADVSGKGVPAALFMVIGKTLIKDHTGANEDLGDVFTKVNELLCESNSEGLFITAFEGVLDLRTGEFRYVNAGHEMPFIYRAGEEFVAEKIRPGFVLAGMEGMKYRSGSIMLGEGDKLFQYTDGVTEATNTENELFGMERLGKSLNAVKDKNTKEIIESVKKDIDAFAGIAPQFDDITMLCLSFKKKLEKE